MQNLSGAISWTAGHWADVVGILGGLVAVATVVTKLTPSTNDDLWVARAAQWLAILHPRGMPGVKLPMAPPKRSQE